MDELRNDLISRYKANPSKVIIKNKEITLPLTIKELLATHKLTRNEFNMCLTAYFKHKTHTAWRYLLKPNPFISYEASFVNFDPLKPWNRWSTFDEYQPLILMFWLAATDKDTPVTDGHTLEGRIAHFIDELSLMGRTHNWDSSRITTDETLEEYDDLKRDKPICYSGVKRLLFQSVIGHPLIKMLTLEDIKMETRDFVRNHFINMIKDVNKKDLLTAFEYYHKNITYNENTIILKKLDIATTQVDEFISNLTKKYGPQFTRNPSFKKYILEQLKLRVISGKPIDYAHALKFDALVGLRQLLKKSDSTVRQLGSFGVFTNHDENLSPGNTLMPTIHSGK